MPFAKTGGLADVAGALPLELGRLGAEVVLMMPKYRGIPFGQKKLSPNVHAVFVENEAFFNRSSLYGNEKGDYPDNLERFSFFSKRVLEITKAIEFAPDIIHLNDWQTALIAVYLKKIFSNESFFDTTKSFLTIHNQAYQGIFSKKLYPAMGLEESLFSIEGFEFHDKINLLKAGLLFSDAIGTVSPTYAQEIQGKEFGFGLEEIIKRRSDSLYGILNGIDTQLWDPAKDKKIKKTFSLATLENKAMNKAYLQKTLGFEQNPDIPLFSMVTRLAEQKGLESFSEIADEFLSKKVQFVILGEGDGVYHTLFRNIGARHPKNSLVNLGFDSDEAHQIYAAADFFLMPSLFEPCGLGQMISLKYGTLPIVRHTGGLADTILNIDKDGKSGNGFVFTGKFSAGLMRAINRAIKLFEDKKGLNAARKRAMKADFSWKHSAKEYMRAYKAILSN